MTLQMPPQVLNGEGRSAPALQPPVAVQEVEPAMRSASVPALKVIPGPVAGPAEAAARACPACAQTMTFMDILLRPLQACQGTAAGMAPEMEVAADGTVTYEWKAVLERQR
mmetsp:Transcript_101433/g.180322  ORF Transcript_101433/g.180322 Transcript_101433/m.180322 type:complete len:111 (-) Transcript_101433:69-401(-)